MMDKSAIKSYLLQDDHYGCVIDTKQYLNGYRIFKPLLKSEYAGMELGLPIFGLVNGDEIRYSTPEELDEILQILANSRQETSSTKI